MMDSNLDDRDSGVFTVSSQLAVRLASMPTASESESDSITHNVKCDH